MQGRFYLLQKGKENTFSATFICLESKRHNTNLVYLRSLKIEKEVLKTIAGSELRISENEEYLYRSTVCLNVNYISNFYFLLLKTFIDGWIQLCTENPATE